MAGSIVPRMAAPCARRRRCAAVIAAAVAAACVAAGRAWCGAAPAGRGAEQRPRVLLHAQGSGEKEKAAGRGADKDTPQGVRMTLDEEFRRGQTLESEFAQVLEARKRGRDIPRPGAIEAKSDLEVSLKRTWRQVSGMFSGIDFTDGPTLFWSTLIGLIVMSWCLTLFR